MKKEDYVMNIRVSGPGKEEVIFGPRDKVNQCLDFANLSLDDLPRHVEIWKRSQGAFFIDYLDVYFDIKSHKPFYEKFKYYLRRFYIPLSQGKHVSVGDEKDDPFDFLEGMKFGKNVIYSYIGCKIDYCLSRKIEIAPTILVDFFFRVLPDDDCVNLYPDGDESECLYYGESVRMMYGKKGDI